MPQDFCMGPIYKALIAAATAGECTAIDCAEAMLEHQQHYHAFCWFLIASTSETHEGVAISSMDDLITAEDICDEDIYLANLQVAAWFFRGIHVQQDALLAGQFLEGAAMPFLQLPSSEDISSTADPGLAAQQAWRAALLAYGFAEGTPTAADVEHVLTKMIADAELTHIDWRLPLGPSTPHQHLWLHPRHAAHSSGSASPGGKP